MFEGLFQPLHLIVILAIALIIFGPGKLPEVGTGLGKSIREFKKAMRDTSQDIDVTSKPGERPEELAAPTKAEQRQETASKKIAETRKETAVRG